LGADWKGQWAETVLTALHTITATQPSRRNSVQKLWATIASNRRNIIPALDFLIVKGMEECRSGDLQLGKTPCPIGKQAALYLSRVASRQTIDHLVHEIAQILGLEDEHKEETATESAWTSESRVSG
jgi:hypothetical protein